MDLVLLFTLIAIIILLLLSAFFSGSETALTGASRARLHHMEQEGDARAGIVNQLRDHPTRLISAILLGNNLVNILASALATSLFIAWFGDIGVAYATLMMTSLVLIFAEVLPKTISLWHPVSVSRFVAPILRPTVFILSPIVKSVDTIVGLTLKVIGVQKPADEALTDAAQGELRGAIDLHSEDAGMVKQEKNMLDSILDMDDVELSEIMSHRKNVEMVDLSKSPADIIDQVLKSPYTRLPIWKGEPENIVGIIHAKDLLRAVMPLKGEYDNIDLMAIFTEPWFVPETTTLLQQLNSFLDRKLHFALVVDEYGALMGVVTLEDILEEIVGEIADEHDEDVIVIEPNADGSYTVQGDETIRDLNRQFNWNLPDEEAATIAGLVINEAQIIPETGQIFSFFGFQFDIASKERNQITELRITPPKPDTD
jgi:magnesium and cobalt exporter, CNNM family